MLFILVFENFLIAMHPELEQIFGHVCSVRRFPPVLSCDSLRGTVQCYPSAVQRDATALSANRFKTKIRKIRPPVLFLGVCDSGMLQTTEASSVNDVLVRLR